MGSSHSAPRRNTGARRLSSFDRGSSINNGNNNHDRNRISSDEPSPTLSSERNVTSETASENDHVEHHSSSSSSKRLSAPPTGKTGREYFEDCGEGTLPAVVNGSFFASSPDVRSPQQDTNPAWIPPVYTPVENPEYNQDYNHGYQGQDEDGCHYYTPTHNDGQQQQQPPDVMEYNVYASTPDDPYGNVNYYGPPPTAPNGEFYYMMPPTPGGPPSNGIVPDFCPQGSKHHEWMGRSLETLVLGFGGQQVAPILCLPEDEEGISDEDTAYLWGATRRRSTVSTLGSCDHGRNSMGSMGGGRRGSLLGSGGRRRHGGTTAHYYNNNRRGGLNGDRRGSNNSTDSALVGSRRGSRTGGGGTPNRRGSASQAPSYRQRRMSSIGRTDSGDSDEVGGMSVRFGSGTGGPNVALSLLARETTGRLTTVNSTPVASRMRSFGGYALFDKLDRPAAGMCSEVGFLAELIDRGDWVEVQTVISRIAPRLIGDPTAMMHPRADRPPVANDPTLPPTASRFFAGGGRVGLERDAFVLAGGVDVLIRVFREPSFVGAEMARTYDARDLVEELVSTRLAPCWNEILTCLRELVYSMPSLVENDALFDNGEFLPFLFTLLSHDSCFDGAATLIEEILSLQSHSPTPQSNEDEETMEENRMRNVPNARIAPPETFFLGNVPDLYTLWAGFNCRQLAHFCRILALLVFEPEDRQLLESPAVLKSIELLQLRRNRAARAGRDSTVDMNQSIILGDELLLSRLLKLLGIMNYAPPLRQAAPFHVMAQNPYIPDTLVMLGLKEITDFKELTRLDRLARTLPRSETNGDFVESSPNLANNRSVCELGAVAEMLENLSRTLSGNAADPSTQLGQIIQVITAAQQAGIIVGRAGRNRPATGQQNQDSDGVVGEGGDASSSSVGILRDQILMHHLSPQNADSLRQSENQAAQRGRPGRANSPSDAANILQFNGLLLGPFQVEVLFVLCTVLGGRRKIDAQEILKRRGIVPVLSDMFERLPWNSLSPSREIVVRSGGRGSFGESNRSSGIHGPGCDCTPESALCVQYLRLLHNFCDRDCDNYDGRRLLLSPSERIFIFENSLSMDYGISGLSPGLLSKVIVAFMGESDESPYRFWLASCVESYLRGSSAAEQVFVVKTGLLSFLMNEITSQRLHCAGSLQTSFDLLGELCKGNTEVLQLLVGMLDEEKFRRLMSVSAANLVDSNVFIRSLLLCLERISFANNMTPLHLEDDRIGTWRSPNGMFSRSYLTHSWWDARAVDEYADNESGKTLSEAERENDVKRPSDWFPSKGQIEVGKQLSHEIQKQQSTILRGGIGHFGWVFTPEGEELSQETHAPDTVERLSWFLAANQTRLLRDLLGVVDLENINHENICCLNTAVVIAIFANRRQHLHTLLHDLKRMNAEEQENQRRAVNATVVAREDDIIDKAFVQAMKYMAVDLEHHHPAPYARRASLTRRSSVSFIQGERTGGRNDILRSFRDVLWFWNEYYAHRGRDRLSLEFSSHLRFQEWMEVVSLLCADDGSPTSLMQSPPMPLPRSPYRRSA